jgi:hypothetical protein
MRFILSIDLGNDAMSTDADIADALNEVIDRLDRHHGDVENIQGSIKDIDGNTVGSYKVLSTERDFMREMRDLAQEAIESGLSCPSTVVGDVADWEVGR